MCAGPDSPCYTDSDWGAPGGWTLMANPTVTSWGPGRLDVLVTAYQWNGSSYTYHLWHRYRDAGFDSGWRDRGTPTSSSYHLLGGAGVTTYSPGSLDVFVSGTDNAICHGVYNDSNGTLTWYNWLTLSSTYTITDSPDAASWLPNRSMSWLHDTNGNLWDCGGSNSGSWGSCSGWSPPTNGNGQALKFTNKPSIIALGDQRVLVASRATDPACPSCAAQGWMKLWDWGKYTGPWVATGGALAGAGVDLSSW